MADYLHGMRVKEGAAEAQTNRALIDTTTADSITHETCEISLNGITTPCGNTNCTSSD
ncbi:hypothetical protein POF45_25475 [Pseudomonas sp. 681]|uniref:Uncharacterized protein n=1 Tax=Pseudomonas fungipugnans TaxID=3024217 RepID=A0ABT6QV23_9PSED|nr:hypothetical protein [Pseudomonas sp. 681]MDI2594755.1 hypothetical protein [Pseudomonas sp. 681]